MNVTSQQKSMDILEINHQKSVHTALAVKACLLRGNSRTKCSITFVNIAVAISALAGGRGAKTVSHRDRNFCTESRSRWCLRDFPTFFGSELKRVLKWKFVSFW